MSQNYCLKFILLYISAVNKSFEDRKGYHIKRESFIVNENTAEEKKNEKKIQSHTKSDICKQNPSDYKCR